MRLGRLLPPLAVALSLAASNPVTFDEAKRTAEISLRTEQGRAYEKAASAHFQEKQGEILRTCFSSESSPDSQPFDLLLFIGQDGRVLDVIAKPLTNIARCLKRGVQSDQFPPAPTKGQWVHFRMNFTP